MVTLTGIIFLDEGTFNTPHAQEGSDVVRVGELVCDGNGRTIAAQISLLELTQNCSQLFSGLGNFQTQLIQPCLVDGVDVALNGAGRNTVPQAVFCIDHAVHVLPAIPVLFGENFAVPDVIIDGQQGTCVTQNAHICGGGLTGNIDLLTTCYHNCHLGDTLIPRHNNDIQSHTSVFFQTSGQDFLFTFIYPAGKAKQNDFFTSERLVVGRLLLRSVRYNFIAGGVALCGFCCRSCLIAGTTSKDRCTHNQYEQHG